MNDSLSRPFTFVNIKKIQTLVLVIIVCSLVGLGLNFPSCEQYAARHYGGTATVNLPKNTKLVNATWKDKSLWYLSRPRRAGETVETWTFQEDSLYGILQGRVVFKERE